MLRSRRFAATAFAALLTLPATAAAQEPERWTTEGVKGRVVEVGPKTVKLQQARGAIRTYALGPRAMVQAAQIKLGSQVVATVDTAEDVIVDFTSIEPPPPTQNVGSDAGGSPARTPTRVLVSADRDCQLHVDFEKAVRLRAGEHVTLRLERGEHIFEAVAVDGATWRQKVTLGGEQIVVEIPLAAEAAADPAELDRAAADVWLGLLDVQITGRYVAAVLGRTSFGFHDPDLGAVLHRAHGGLRRARERLVAMRSTGWRKDAQQELARAAAAADGYVDLLGKAVTAAQQANTVLGEAANLRAKALAEAAALVVEAGTMVRLRASSDFEAAIPLDRHVDAGFPAPAQDIRLGLEYDQESPPRVGLVHKGGLGERLGLEPGDRLLAVADNAISSGWGFMQSLRKTSGQTVRLVVERGRKKRTLEAKVPAVLPQ